MEDIYFHLGFSSNLAHASENNADYNYTFRAMYLAATTTNLLCCNEWQMSLNIKKNAKCSHFLASRDRLFTPKLLTISLSSNPGRIHIWVHIISDLT